VSFSNYMKILREDGETGRRARFRFWFRKEWRFESSSSHFNFNYLPDSRSILFRRGTPAELPQVEVLFDLVRSGAGHGFRLGIVARRDGE
jgi:hypothetical protein